MQSTTGTGESNSSQRGAKTDKDRCSWKFWLGDLMKMLDYSSLACLYAFDLQRLLT